MTLDRVKRSGAKSFMTEERLPARRTVLLWRLPRLIIKCFKLHGENQKFLYTLNCSWRGAGWGDVRCQHAKTLRMIKLLPWWSSFLLQKYLPSGQFYRTDRMIYEALWDPLYFHESVPLTRFFLKKSYLEQDEGQVIMRGWKIYLKQYDDIKF